MGFREKIPWAGGRSGNLPHPRNIFEGGGFGLGCTSMGDRWSLAPKKSLYIPGKFPKNQTHQPQKCFVTAWESVRSPKRTGNSPSEPRPIPHPRKCFVTARESARSPARSWVFSQPPPLPPTQKMFRCCAGECPLAHSPRKNFLIPPRPSPNPKNVSRMRGRVSDIRQTPATGV